MPPITCLIFDCVGVIVHHDTRQFLREALHLDPDNLIVQQVCSEISKQLDLGLITGPELWRDLTTFSGVAMEHDEFYREFFKVVSFDEELLQTVSRLRCNYTTVLLTNNFEENITFYEERIKLNEAFDHVFVSCRLGSAKPDPEIFLMVLDSLGLVASNCVFIDDQMENLRAAENLGFRVIQFRNRVEILSSLQAIGITM